MLYFVYSYLQGGRKMPMTVREKRTMVVLKYACKGPKYAAKVTKFGVDLTQMTIADPAKNLANTFAGGGVDMGVDKAAMKIARGGLNTVEKGSDKVVKMIDRYMQKRA